MLSHHRTQKSSAGFTLVETAAAMGLVGTFIAILMVMSSNIFALIRSAKDNISASQTLQERIELVRGANWLQLTNATYVSTDILGFNSDSTNGLKEATETITIAPYPAVAGVKPIKVVRKKGLTTIVSSEPTLRSVRVVRVDVELAWRGVPNNRTHTRTTTTVVSRTGNK